jgi:hypothetical protein
MKPVIFVAEEDFRIRKLFGYLIQSHFDFDVEMIEAENGIVAREKLKMIDEAGRDLALVFFGDVPGISALEFFGLVEKIKRFENVPKMLASYHNLAISLKNSGCRNASFISKSVLLNQISNRLAVESESYLEEIRLKKGA